jgi:hypothetical protein
MKIRYRQTGGFAGLSLGAELDTETLPVGEARELERLVKRAALHHIGDRKSRGGRDLTSYEMTVEDQGRTTKASFDDMTIPSNAQALLDFVRSRATARPLDD